MSTAALDATFAIDDRLAYWENVVRTPATSVAQMNAALNTLHNEDAALVDRMSELDRSKRPANRFLPLSLLTARSALATTKKKLEAKRQIQAALDLSHNDVLKNLIANSGPAEKHDLSELSGEDLEDARFSIDQALHNLHRLYTGYSERGLELPFPTEKWNVLEMEVRPRLQKEINHRETIVEDMDGGGSTRRRKHPVRHRRRTRRRGNTRSKKRRGQRRSRRARAK